MKPVTCLGQPSWRFTSDVVDARVTQLGGHLAPVQFKLGRRTVSPYSVAPWAEEKLSADIPPLLRALRGDFFCLPFGGNDEIWRGENHPPHGETANSSWHFESMRKRDGETALHLSLQTRVRRGRVDKKLFLREGQTALYSRHVLSGFTGRMNLGHHATLRFPDKEGAGRISTSQLKFGQVLPMPFEHPEQRGYSCLKPGATFRRLDRVKKLDGGFTDLGRYPARRGFDDLAIVVHQDRPDFAWTAATFPEEGYVWFSLKDPRVLRSTTFWISNGGRHYAPWNSRHVNVMGLEDVTSYFHLGLPPSLRANALNKRGIATSLPLQRRTPLVVNYIMAVAAVPRGFESVKKIIPTRDGITLISTKNHRVTSPVDTSFLYQTTS